jgi:hypothetical protein
LDVKILLKGLNLHGNRRLGNMEHVSRPGNAFFFGCQVESSELIKIDLHGIVGRNDL